MDDEGAQLLNYMPMIVRDGNITAWERTFCASMIARGKRQAFRPTQQQMSILRRIVRAFQNRNMRQDDGEWEVVE